MSKKSLYRVVNSSKENDESFYLLTLSEYNEIKEIDDQILDLYWEAKEILDELVLNGSVTEEERRLNYYLGQPGNLYNIEKIVNYDFIPNEIRGRYYALMHQRKSLLKGNPLEQTIDKLSKFTILFFGAFIIIEFIKFFTETNFRLFKFERDWLGFAAICAIVFFLTKLIYRIIIPCNEENGMKDISTITWNTFSRIGLPLVIIFWFL